MPLAITPLEPQRPADVVLKEIAENAARSGIPVAGQTEYMEMRNWYLHSQISGGSTVSAIQPETRQPWRRPDGSGRSVTRTGEPEFRSEADRDAWESASGGVGERSWGPIANPRRPPTDVQELAKWLYRQNPPGSIGPIKTFVATTDHLLSERVLLPTERAAVLRLIADLPGLRLDGRTSDRVDRPALVFSLDSAYGALTTSPGELNVSIPAVIKYETYLRAEFQS